MLRVKTIQYTKMHGLGNNYIYINCFEENLVEEELSNLAKSVSDIYTGIGSDGMILICPSDIAPVKMRIFNKDGSEGKNCGNGLRCVAKYAYEFGIVKETSFPIETLSGIVHADLEVSGGEVKFITINMGEPIFEAKNIPILGEVEQEISFEGKGYVSLAVSMGNPHTVIVVDKIEEAPLTTLGPIIETSDLYPEGVNVEFIEIVSPTEINFRVWERGSGVTQACGTGACAAAVVAILREKAQKNTEITVHLAGGDLFITWNEENHVMMRGEAEVICSGEYYFRG